ncbi:MAG TPA: purine-nucleoside phosphorylase [Gemmataceae bacterium]|nr:purine-nucleoside phosphorylase [Gemmataceae bacterium]
MSQAASFTSLTDACRATPPAVALVLGSGMSGVAAGLTPLLTVPFGAIPGLTATSVAGHRGRLTLGEWAGRRVLVFEGRLHFYEGHSWEAVTLPVRLAAALGVRVLLQTNAAGGIRDDLGPGSLMVIHDHIEWTRPYCWREPGPGGLGPSRPSPYAQRLLDLLSEAAEPEAALSRGIYAAVTGPCYETPAEIRALRAWGADAVGMSTAREAQAGYDLGLECAAISCITNRAAGLGGAPLDHQEVLATAAAQTARLARLVTRFLERL